MKQAIKSWYFSTRGRPIRSSNQNCIRLSHEGPRCYTVFLHHLEVKVLHGVASTEKGGREIVARLAKILGEDGH